MQVIVVTSQSDGDVYVQGVYRNQTEENIREVFLQEMSERYVDEMEFHHVETSTKVTV